MSNDFECPICGAMVKANTLACPECGADERTGLYRSNDSSGAIYDGLDLPDDDTFNYDEFAEREFGTPRPKSAKDYTVAVIAVLMIVVIFAVFVLW
ncbi:zinc ribbon domain-containing protein [Cerasicoccus arenae]|uniref:Zinc ribbon domain-containing protein n=1 Tax=Cerasicoccus arenae TaxID=424488 RepID=A0A8J3DLI6_9BACT|nr:zinc ribbon domain-containing protein [Cerasicoccus arenae]MBK1857429.1 hypothetical protein [Cerasicoccus arenae]GHC07771.1 hypothetical protein GCM10007047_26190 [Cerasicoccus arenae]